MNWIVIVPHLLVTPLQGNGLVVDEDHEHVDDSHGREYYPKAEALIEGRLGFKK